MALTSVVIIIGIIIVIALILVILFFALSNPPNRASVGMINPGVGTGSASSTSSPGNNNSTDGLIRYGDPIIIRNANQLYINKCGIQRTRVSYLASNRISTITWKLVGKSVGQPVLYGDSVNVFDYNSNSLISITNITVPDNQSTCGFPLVYREPLTEDVRRLDRWIIGNGTGNVRIGDIVTFTSASGIGTMGICNENSQILAGLGCGNQLATTNLNSGWILEQSQYDLANSIFRNI